MVRYRNRNTKEVKTFPEPSARLEALPVWERLDDEPDQGDVAPSSAASGRAEAERASIAAANADRMSNLETGAKTAAEIAAASAVAPLPDTPANVTLAHQATGAYRATTSVLERAREDAARIGAGMSDAELQAQADAASKAIHALGNEGGVLARQHGYIQPAAGGGVAVVTDDGTVGESGPVNDTGGEPERPADNASTAAWAEYVVARGLMSAEEADGLKRKDLIEKAGPAE